MHNPIKNSYMIACYAQFGVSETCKTCLVAGYCQDAKKDLRIESAFCGAGEYTDRLPAPKQTAEEPTAAEPQDAEPHYSREELLKLVNFFMELTPTNFMILKLRILHPEMTNTGIAKLMRMGSDKPIYRFFAEICERYPELEAVLYSRKTVKK